MVRVNRLLASAVVVGGLASCGRAVQDGGGRDTPMTSRACATLGQIIDSAFAVNQAIAALEPPPPVTLTPRSIQGVEGGVLISIVASTPRGTRGHGGLVYVDEET